MQKPSKWPGHMETVNQEIVHVSWPCVQHDASVSCQDAWRRVSLGLPLHSAVGRTLTFDNKKEESE